MPNKRALHLQGGAIAVVDNSMLAPIFAQPLALGADVCMTSATKFIGGHSDVTAGILSVKDAALAERVAFVQARLALACAPNPLASELVSPQLRSLPSGKRPGLSIEQVSME